MEMMPNKSNVKIVYMTNGDGATNEKGSRMKEALSAIKILGYDQSHIIDGQMPFYHLSDRKITDQDFLRFEGILKEFKPNHIFLCKDSDPNKTHDKCCEIVEHFSNFESLKYMWYYMGAWGQLGKGNEYTPNCRVTINEKNYLKKLLAIKMHISQDPPVVGGKDSRSFVERALEADRSKTDVNVFEEKFHYVQLK